MFAVLLSLRFFVVVSRHVRLIFEVSKFWVLMRHVASVLAGSEVLRAHAFNMRRVFNEQNI